jgi:hypothetical protein
VLPPLELNTGGLATAQAVVISAPAAVGKSMLAEYVALRTGGVIWDLAQASVGNNFAIGHLAASHGVRALSDVVSRIHQGRFLVVADALDEAKLRVTFDSFTAFLDDLSRQLLKGIRAGTPAVVLLARRETADFAADWLEKSLDVALVRATIGFFDRQGATEFVNRQLAAQGRDPDNTALAASRDMIFDRTLGLLGIEPSTEQWPDEPARRFLGYAPVLVATARFLGGGGNPQRVAEQLRAESNPTMIWKLLAELLEDMLAREQQKFIEGFQERCSIQAETLGFSSWDQLFTPGEQIGWLVTGALGTESPEVCAPGTLEAPYRSEVHAWMPEHPFLGASEREFATAVFQDFAYATVLLRGDDESRRAVRARAAQASYRPTEMLARFFFDLAGEAAAVEAEDLTVIYESLLAAEDAGKPVALNLVNVEGEIEHLCFITIGSQERVALEILVGDAPLWFATKLANATIFTDTPLVLGTAGRLLELGPNVLIAAPSIDIASESLFVENGSGAMAVMLITGKLTSSDPKLRFIYGGQHFHVQADEPPRYPFADKRVSIRFELRRVSPTEQQVARALFRVAGMFKTEGYEGLGSYVESVDRLAGRNTAAAQVLDVALEKGIIVKEGGIYKFRPELLNMNYSAVQGHDLSETAVEFVKEAARGLK